MTPHFRTARGAIVVTAEAAYLRRGEWTIAAHRRADGGFDGYRKIAELEPLNDAAHRLVAEIGAQKVTVH